MSESPRVDWAEHDANLAALYRAAAVDQPPPALDAAIRAAARRAVAAKPRIAGVPFSRPWRVPLSIAAVVLLSVSLVTIMREEAPEIALPPRADAPRPDADRRMAESAPAERESDTAVPKILSPGEQKPRSVGLKPPGQTRSEGIGIPGYKVSPEPVAATNKESAGADRLEGGAPSALRFGKREAPDAFPGAGERHKEEDTARGAKLRQPAEAELRRDVGVGVEAQPRLNAARPTRSPAEPGASAPAPATPPAANSERAAGAGTDGKDSGPQTHTGRLTPESSRAHLQAQPAAKALARPLASQVTTTVQDHADLPPAKWLEQIEELRKQGRYEAAKTSLAAFKQRHPDYPLPAALRDWTTP